jgi:hypothetical protein
MKDAHEHPDERERTHELHESDHAVHSRSLRCAKHREPYLDDGLEAQAEYHHAADRVQIAACAQQPASVPPPPEPQPIRVVPKDRCTQYVQVVKEQHFMRFGLEFPSWYGVGQLRQESACRADAVAFDGGKGLSQFMPATEKYVEASLGPLDMMNPRDAIRV